MQKEQKPLIDRVVYRIHRIYRFIQPEWKFYVAIAVALFSVYCICSAVSGLSDRLNGIESGLSSINQRLDDIEHELSLIKR